MSTQIIVHAHDFAEDAERYQAVTGKHSVNLQIAEHGTPFIYLHARTWADLREALHTLDMKIIDQQRRERMAADEDDADRHPQGEATHIEYLAELGTTIIATLHAQKATDPLHSLNLDHIRARLTARNGGVVPQGWMIALRNLVHAGHVVRTDAPTVGLARYHLPEGVTHDAAH